MSGLLGTQLAEDYIQVGDVKLPLPKNPDNRGEEYETLRTTPLEPFQASAVIGDDSLISDDRIAQAVFSDFRPGLGKRRYTEVESVNGYQDGDLLTVEGVATLPVAPVALGGTLVAAVANPTPPGFLSTGFGYNWGARYNFAVWSPDNSRIYIYDSDAGGSFVLPTTIPNIVAPYSAMAYFAGRYVACTLTGIYYSSDGQAFSTSWVPGGTLTVRGLVAHDGKLYALIHDSATSSVKFYWVATQAQLTAGVAWPASSVETLPIDLGESITNIVDWKDKLDDRQIFVLTNKRIISYNDADFWAPFWNVPDWQDGGFPFGFVNPRDDLLYVCFGWRNNSVFVFNHQTVEEQGPNREFGLPLDAGAFTIGILAGNSRHMFALGSTLGSPGSQGRILISNDAFGWSSMLRSLGNQEDFTVAPVATERITGMLAFGGRVVAIKQSGAASYLPWPDRAVSVYNLPITGAYARTYAGGYHWLYGGEFDAGAELLWKVAKYWTVHLERASGVYALSGNAQFVLKYRIDGGAWVTLSTLTSASTFPARFPLPSLSDQQGVPFRKVEWAFGMRAEASATSLETPILRAITLAYTREPDIYDGLQVVVDLSRERWDQLPTSLFYGLDRAALRNYLDTLKSGPGIAKRHYPVTIGWAGYQKVYASCDVRVSGVEDPQDRYGHFSLTLREVTAPPSG